MKKIIIAALLCASTFSMKAQSTVSAQSWFSYGNNAMSGYSWTNSALTTNSIEIVNNNGTYIDLSHRLPDMPSEKEVIENGVDLGEMNKRLVKKVEELTLYLIKKDKELRLKDERINAIELQLKHTKQ